MTRGQIEPSEIDIKFELKDSKKVTILHISDLHFTSDTDIKRVPISALVADVLKFKKDIDLIICTGDLTHNPLTEAFSDDHHKSSMKKVRSFLESLCTLCKLDPRKRLFVVPGNHDYRIQGLFRRKASVARFHEYFDVYFRNCFVPEHELLIYSFDSNTADAALNFATGLIDQDDLVKFQDKMHLWSEAEPEKFASATKIVLLHHHPMPISETETRAVIDGEEFLLLKNAGTFMKEMIKERIDLILHGHKHFIGYSQARFPLVNGFHDLGVVAAGSAGQVYNGIYSYNLVTVPKDSPIGSSARGQALQS